MEEKKKSGFSTAGLVLGIIGLCTSFMPIINNLSFVMGVLAIIFGLIAFVKKCGKVKNIIVVVLGILAIIITINSQEQLSKSLNETINTFNEDMNTLSGKNTDEVLKNLDVSMGNFEVTGSQYLTETKLVVKLINKTSETKSFSVQIEAIKPDGTRITTDTIYANNLTAGQGQEFNAFTFVSSDNIEAMKTATFKVLEASMY